MVFEGNLERNLHTQCDPLKQLEVGTTAQGKVSGPVVSKAYLSKLHLLALLKVDGTLLSMGGPGYFNDIYFCIPWCKFRHF